MKILHLVKTPVGAFWAYRQIEVLRKLGVDVTVVVPPGRSPIVPRYKACNCRVIRFNADFPIRRPHELKRTLYGLRCIIDDEKPDIIHSHFVGTTLTMRLALGQNSEVLRVFQVPGPLHLEHWFFRKLEISLSGESDYWIGSSKCIIDWYRKSGIESQKLFLSYYGFEMNNTVEKPTHWNLRTTLGIAEDRIVIGNVNFIYPPKYYLGQRVGLKCHEDIITALAEIIAENDKVIGVFIGGPWGKAHSYEQRLRKRAKGLAGDRILFTGSLPFDKGMESWRAFDLGIHVPLSENCGGVVEPLFHGVPVVASHVGGLPEVVIEGKTGWLVPPRKPDRLANAIRNALENYELSKRMALAGKALVRQMFDVNRTASEVYGIYGHILDSSRPPPAPYNSETFLRQLVRGYEHN